MDSHANLYFGILLIAMLMAMAVWFFVLEKLRERKRP